LLLYIKENLIASFIFKSFEKDKPYLSTFFFENVTGAETICFTRRDVVAGLSK